MKATETGIEMNKAELTALLAFTGNEEPFDCVYFAISAGDGKLNASATNGHRACEVFSQFGDEKAQVGE